MIKFDNLTNTNPLNGVYSQKNRSSIVLSKSMGKLFSPYEGVVVAIYNKKCSGYLLIKHIINNEEYYSEFCEIPKVIVGKNDYVKKGQTIGYFLSDTDYVTYTLYSSNKTQIDPTPFFKGFTIKSNQSNNSQYTKPDKHKEKQSSDNNRKKRDIKPANYNLLLSLALSPFDLISKQAGKIVKNTGKELKKSAKGIFDFKTTKPKEDEEETLNEDIQRIKKLL
jgi:hypothetical protein